MSNGFLSDKEIANKGAKVHWDKNERDKALDEYYAGANPTELGIKYKGAPKAFKVSILGKLDYNIKREGQDKGRAEVYQPVRRTSRKGKRFTKNELLTIARHKEIGLNPIHTATLLCRPIEELTGAVAQEMARVKEIKPIGPILDLIWAYRYCYFVYKTPVISDESYDSLVQEECEYGGGAGRFQIIKDHKGWPEHIKSLALYLVLKGKHEKMAGH